VCVSDKIPLGFRQFLSSVENADSTRIQTFDISLCPQYLYAPALPLPWDGESNLVLGSGPWELAFQLLLQWHQVVWVDTEEMDLKNKHVTMYLSGSTQEFTASIVKVNGDTISTYRLCMRGTGQSAAGDKTWSKQQMQHLISRYSRWSILHAWNLWKERCRRVLEKQALSHEQLVTITSVTSWHSWKRTQIRNQQVEDGGVPLAGRCKLGGV
jgi:hypothetical protein